MVQLILLPHYAKEKENEYRSGWKAGEKLYIIEVKKFRNEKQIQDSCIQLNAYLEQMDGEGCLLIYADTDLKIINEKWNFDVLTIYIGDESPSLRSGKTTIRLA